MRLLSGVENDQALNSKSVAQNELYTSPGGEFGRCGVMGKPPKPPPIIEIGRLFTQQ
jgi:hypothetical protein